MSNDRNIGIEVARREVFALEHPYSPWKMDPELRARWKDPAVAYADIGPLPPGLGPLAAMLAPKDPKEPIGPGNAQWVTDVERNRINQLTRKHRRYLQMMEDRKLARTEVLTFREIRWAFLNPTDELLKTVGKAAISAAMAFMEDEKAVRRGAGLDKAPDMHLARSADPEYNKLYVTWWRRMASGSDALCPAWRVFSDFFADIKKLGPKPRFARLAPVDKSRPMGPDNVQWVRGGTKS